MLQRSHSGNGDGGQGATFSSSATAPLPPKRQKIAVACNPCKSRKSKCDGGRPICGSCAKRVGGQRNDCVYRNSTASQSIEPQLTLSANESAAAQWQSSQSLPEYQSSPNRSLSSPSRNVSKGRGQRLPGPAGRSGVQAEAINHEPLQVWQADIRDNLATSSRISLSNGAVIDDREPSAESISSNFDQNADAMGCVDDWALRIGLLGSSSGASFLRHIQKVADGVGGSPNQSHRDMVSPYVNQTLRSLGIHGKSRQDLSMTQFVLPPRKTADYLLNVYWEFSQSIFPILNRLEFDKLYPMLWEVSADAFPDEQVFHCMLNLMFAMACKVDPNAPPNESTKSAEVFFERARSLSKFDLLEISRFPLVQVSLLMAQYLQSTNMPRQCIQSIRLAVWIAQDIGLHMPHTISSLTDSYERELAKRIWHCCILFDRLAAMTFGRPLSISQDVAALVPPLRLIDDEYFDPTKNMDPDHATKIEFFDHFYKLHYILGDILSILYAGPELDPRVDTQQPNTRPFSGDLESLFENDQKLEQWKNGLANHLQVSFHICNPGTDVVFHRQANLLYLRYLYIRLLMLRTCFTRGSHLLRISINDSRKSATAQLKGVVVSRTLSLCVKTAIELVDFIYTRIFDKSLERTLPSWWYNITYIYSAATVIIATQCFLHHVDESTISMLSPSLQNSYKILEHYHARTPTARRCQTALEMTHQKIIGLEVPNQQSGQDTTGSEAHGDVFPTSEFNDLRGVQGFDPAISTFPMFDSPDAAWLDSTMAYWDFNLWR